MKLYLHIIFFLFLFISGSINAQKTWLNNDLKETKMAKATFYKVVLEKGNTVSYFYKSGNIFRKIIYVDGKIEGKFSEFYETGELKIVGRYKNGMRVGSWKTYTKKGKIKERGKYKKGEKVGVWRTFYKNEK